MTGNFKHSMELLEGNEENVQREARHILFKLCNNILKYPTNARYRKVRLSNPIVMGKLLPASGAIECLFEAGFIEVMIFFNQSNRARAQVVFIGVYHWQSSLNCCK